MQVGMYSSWHSCLHACKQSRTQAIQRAGVYRSAGAQAVQAVPIKKIFFQKKKEKESNLIGRDTDRPKGIGISPEGCLVRNEQGIMPKSFCQTVKPVIPSVSFYYFFWIKYLVNRISCLINLRCRTRSSGRVYPFG